jgi:DNA repair exonuclease SbcCD nuclease subunit
MVKPIAVLISDIHYSLPNLKLADVAMKQAIAKANELEISLIVAGDLHDTKANLRGECVNAMIETFKECVFMPYVLIGNHDRLNEKDPRHSLNFLNPYVNIIGISADLISPNGVIKLISYDHDSNELRKHIKTIPKRSILIMHQGIMGSNSGEYMQDKSAITKEDVVGMRVISGHYHTRQTIKLPDGGTWDYIGNPYTQNFGEANDPPKGFQILMSDGSLKFVPTNLRKHVVLNIEKANNDHWQITGKVPLEDIRLEDLVWAKVTGTKEQLSKVNKEFVAKLIDKKDFRLDLIPLDTTTKVDSTIALSQSEVLDSLIDSLTNTNSDTKCRLKQTWKKLCE